MDNVFIERVWRSLKYEEVHLKAYAGGGEARAGAATQKAISIVLICCRCRYVLSPLMFWPAAGVPSPALARDWKTT